MVAAWALSCCVSLVASLIAARCSTEGNVDCATKAGSIASTAGCFAAVFIAISMYNTKQRMA